MFHSDPIVSLLGGGGQQPDNSAAIAAAQAAAQKAVDDAMRAKQVTDMQNQAAQKQALAGAQDVTAQGAQGAANTAAMAALAAANQKQMGVDATANPAFVAPVGGLDLTAAKNAQLSNVGGAAAATAVNSLNAAAMTGNTGAAKPGAGAGLVPAANVTSTARNNFTLPSTQGLVFGGS